MVLPHSLELKMQNHCRNREWQKNHAISYQNQLDVRCHPERRMIQEKHSIFDDVLEIVDCNCAEIKNFLCSNKSREEKMLFDRFTIV